MALVPRFEDLQAWQEARKLVIMVYKLTASGLLAKDYGVRDQIQRASVSAMTKQMVSIVNPKQNSRAFWDLQDVPLSRYSRCFTPLMISVILQKHSLKNITNKPE